MNLRRHIYTSQYSYKRRSGGCYTYNKPESLPLTKLLKTEGEPTIELSNKCARRNVNQMWITKTLKKSLADLKSHNFFQI